MNHRMNRVERFLIGQPGDFLDRHQNLLLVIILIILGVAGAV